MRWSVTLTIYIYHGHPQRQLPPADVLQLDTRASSVTIRSNSSGTLLALQETPAGSSTHPARLDERLPLKSARSPRP